MRRVTRLAAIMLFAACAAPSADTSNNPSNAASGRENAAAAVDTLRIFFAQLAPDLERAYPIADRAGALVSANGCLRLRPSAEYSDTTSYLVVWAPYFEISASSGAIQVLDRRTMDSIQLGESVVVGGGDVELSPELLRELQAPIPKQCSGPFYLAGSIAVRRES